MALHSFWGNMPHCWIDKLEKLKSKRTELKSDTLAKIKIL